MGIYILRFTAFIFGLLILSGCTTWSLEELRTADRQGSAFHKALAEEYLAFADAEAKEYDWVDSQHFANKGLQAAYGQDVAPEELGSWKIPTDKLSDLQKARDTLLKAMTPAGLQKDPESAARAQAMFDCWVEQQEENWQSDDIEDCKERFTDALNTLIDAQDPVASTLTRIASYIVFFDWNRFDLPKNAGEILTRILEDIKNIHNYEIVLHGHADSSGSDEHNMELSQKRIDAVKRALIAQGVPESVIKSFAFGESDPRIPTEDRTREEGNRRVEIFIGQ